MTEPIASNRPPNFFKLPRKTRFYIEKLERDLEAAYKTINMFSDPDAPIQIERFMSNKPAIGIQRGETITFRIPTLSGLEDGIEVRFGMEEDRLVKVRAIRGAIVIEPIVSNEIAVYPERSRR